MSKKMKDKSEKPDFPATVVGGQPQNSPFYENPITAVEILLALASESDSDKERFLANPVDYADRSGVDLTDTEQKMLSKTGRRKLERMVATLEQSGSVTRRFILLSGALAATALIGIKLATPKNYPKGHVIRYEKSEYLNYSIYKIEAKSEARKSEIEKILHMEKACLNFISRRFIDVEKQLSLNKEFKLKLDFQIKNGAVKFDISNPYLRPELDKQDLEILPLRLKSKCGHGFNQVSFKEGETFSITLLFPPKTRPVW